MHIIPTTEARKRLADLVSAVRYTNKPIAIGRRNKAEALLINFPDRFNKELNEETNMNQYGKAFDFLENESNLYSKADLKKSYV